MHVVRSYYKRTEQNGVPLSNPSLVMASYSLKQPGPDYYERWELAIMITLKQKYLQHSYHVSFMFLASYSHYGTFSTAAMCIIVNSMVNSSFIFVWWSLVSQFVTEWNPVDTSLINWNGYVSHNRGNYLNQQKISLAKYLYVTFSHLTVKLLPCETINAYTIWIKGGFVWRKTACKFYVLHVRYSSKEIYQ